jgi:limonene-1,2-epoxide hydrolase
MTANLQIVSDFVAAWNAKDRDAIVGFFSDDAVYHNIPMAAVQGLAAVSATIDSFVGMASEMDWTIHHMAESNDGVILNERTDRFKVGEKWLEIRVMGTFEIADGKITAWRDYFDLAQFQSQLPGND